MDHQIESSQLISANLQRLARRVWFAGATCWVVVMAQWTNQVRDVLGEWFGVRSLEMRVGFFGCGGRVGHRCLGGGLRNLVEMGRGINHARRTASMVTAHGSNSLHPCPSSSSSSLSVAVNPPPTGRRHRKTILSVVSWLMRHLLDYGFLRRFSSSPTLHSCHFFLRGNASSPLQCFEALRENCLQLPLVLVEGRWLQNLEAQDLLQAPSLAPNLRRCPNASPRFPFDLSFAQYCRSWTQASISASSLPYRGQKIPGRAHSLRLSQTRSPLMPRVTDTADCHVYRWFSEF